MDLAGMLEGGREDDLDREPLDCVGEQFAELQWLTHTD